ncbi:MAG: L,D-transpeptidase family protein, partial [Pseudomonadota bacterium]|nr:L,D-transpeptidase family protein [Pseudomonadota bacterium]
TILATLQDAESHGFRPGEFLPPELSSLMSSPNPADRARGDTLLRAYIRYARAQHGLRISNWPKNWALRPAPYDAEADFNFAVSQDRLAQWIETLPPPFDRYRLLKAALVKYRAIEAAGGWPTIDPGPELKLGATGPRVAALRKRLLIEEPSLNTDTSADSDTFDQSLLDALQFYQRRNGIDTTGTVGKYTLEALNVPVDSRILQIVANMERWRWAPRLWPATRIEVNIAAAEMTLFQENALTLEMRAAPGRPDDQTPMLGSQIESVVFNPPWNVPQGIMEKEYLPKEAAHPGYLAAHGFRFIETPDGGRRLQQASGAKSALGQVKFDFPNAFAVYLHDTPTRKAFGSDSRNVSHGCVRLERPIDLADKVFEGDPSWTPDAIQDTIQDGKTKRVALTSAMPVFLLYFTVYPDVKGRMDFRNDVYDWDSQLLRLIAASR